VNILKYWYLKLNVTFMKCSIQFQGKIIITTKFGNLKLQGS